MGSQGLSAKADGEGGGSGKPNGRPYTTSRKTNEDTERQIKSSQGPSGLGDDPQKRLYVWEKSSSLTKLVKTGWVSGSREARDRRASHGKGSTLAGSLGGGN